MPSFVAEKSMSVTHSKLLLFFFLLLSAISVHAEQLPIRTYTAADGLAQNLVLRIVRDSRGYLWFCTGEGLSRYDGYKFTNYTTDQGLPHRSIRDLLETRTGRYWLATGGGLVLFDPDAAKFRTEKRTMFTTYRLPTDELGKGITVLYEDRSGTVWCGTTNGLYRLRETEGRPTFEHIELGTANQILGGSQVEAILEDRHGSLWIGTRGSGLFRLLTDGRVERYTTRQGLPVDRINAVFEDRQGHLWIGTSLGLCLLATAPQPNHVLVDRVFAKANAALPSDWVEAIFQSSDNRLWVALSGGLSEVLFADNDREPTFRSYTSAEGLGPLDLTDLAEDNEGNLWIGATAGAMKLARNGFVTITEINGQRPFIVEGMLETQAGELCFLAGVNRKRVIVKNGEKGLSVVQPNFPRHITYFGWGFNQVGLQDRQGEWWLPTGQGLVRFPKVDRVEQLEFTQPKAVYTKKDGLTSDHVWRIHEDSEGDIWFETASEVAGLTRWDRKTGKFHNFTHADGLPEQGWATAFVNDRAGNLWIAMGSTLVRYAMGNFELFDSIGLPAGGINDLHLDGSGRLWIASDTGGLSRLDNPQVKQPTFVPFTTAQGLSSNQILDVTSDQAGLIYCFSGRGVDRVDPSTGQVEHYSTGDGLVGGAPKATFRDRQGSLWFASDLGISRLSPESNSRRTPLPILISEVRIGGERYPLSELGESEVPEIRLGPDQNQIQIDFVGLNFGSPEQVRYQYKLEGADTDWTASTFQRTVNYARLAPGSYRFLVRALRNNEATNQPTASIRFTILPPFWQRWWFVMMVALSIGLLAYALYRYRLVRLLELERVRTRIATDLHDDIGSNLSLIAMASEVANRQAKGHDERLANWLSLISTTSRETVDSMSDIVWAVNPAKDRLIDLVQRMRRVAEEILSSRDIAFHFSAPENEADVRLAADTRREVFMIFKEGLNNIARHSQANKAELAMNVVNRTLVLKLLDDGCGFELNGQSQGNGLASMRRRAEKLNGNLKIESRQDQGTSVTLSVPLDGSGKFGL